MKRSSFRRPYYFLSSFATITTTTSTSLLASNEVKQEIRYTTLMLYSVQCTAYTLDILNECRYVSCSALEIDNRTPNILNRPRINGIDAFSRLDINNRHFGFLFFPIYKYYMEKFAE